MVIEQFYTSQFYIMHKITFYTIVALQKAGCSILRGTGGLRVGAFKIVFDVLPMILHCFNDEKPRN